MANNNTENQALAWKWTAASPQQNSPNSIGILIWTVHLHWVQVPAVHFFPGCSLSLQKRSQDSNQTNQRINSPQDWGRCPSRTPFFWHKKSRFRQVGLLLNPSGSIGGNKTFLYGKTYVDEKFMDIYIYILDILSLDIFAGAFEVLLSYITFGPALSTVAMDFLVENGFPSFKKICSHCGTWGSFKCLTWLHIYIYIMSTPD